MKPAATLPVPSLVGVEVLSVLGNDVVLGPEAVVDNGVDISGPGKTFPGALS